MELEEPVSEALQQIIEECREAKASPWVIGKIVKELRAEKNPRRDQLRRRTLELLTQFDPKAGKTFESFQRLTVRTSGMEIQRFDRGNIIHSLLKETSISRPMAEKIGAEVEDKIKDLDIQYLSTALIREMVIGRLLEYGLENIRRQYCRLGLPVYDVDHLVSENRLDATAILSKYHLAKTIPPRLADYHFAGEIHIASLWDFSIRPVAESVRVDELADEASMARLAHSLARAKQQSGIPPTVEGVAHAIRIKSKKRRNELALAFWSMVSAIESQGTTAGVVQLSPFAPARWTEPGTGRSLSVENVIAVHSAFGKMTEPPTAYYPVLAFDSKYQVKILDTLTGQVEILNCTRDELLAWPEFCAPRPVSGHYRVHAERLSAEGDSETRFVERLLKRADALVELETVRRESLSERSFHAHTDWTAWGAHVGFTGLAQAVARITNETQPVAQARVAERWLRDIRKRLSDFAWSVELLARHELVERDPVLDWPAIEKTLQTTHAKTKTELVDKIEAHYARIRYKPETEKSAKTN